MKSLIILFFTICFLCTLKGQKLKDDPYVHLCFKFSEDLNSDVSISTIKTYFDTSVWSDSLELKLKDCRSALKKDRERIDYYITRFQRPQMVFYNVSLHHPESKTGYGDLRIVFKDQDDFLIDDWIYLPEVEIEEDEDLDAMGIVPLPPPPPGKK